MTTPATFALEPLPPLGALEPLWRGFDRGGAHSFFLTWPWIAALLRAMERPPLLLKVMRGGEIVGLALLALRQRKLGGVLPLRQAWLNASGETALDGVMIEHNGFALPSGADATLLPALVAWFAAGGIEADELILPGIACKGLEQADEGLIAVEHRREGYRTPLAGGIESRLSRNTRQQLRRSIRDYATTPAVHVAPDGETALAWFAELKRLHIRSWTRRGRRHAFDNPHFEGFHRALIGSGADVDLLRIAAGERTLGYLYNFRRNGVVSNYQSGFDDAEPGLRPGYVCHAAAMAHYAQAGMSHYDFLAGSNRLKQSLGTERYALCWRHYRKPTLPFRAERLARRAAALVRRKAVSEG